jgi:hypothetical protein
LGRSPNYEAPQYAVFSRLVLILPT